LLVHVAQCEVFTVETAHDWVTVRLEIDTFIANILVKVLHTHSDNDVTDIHQTDKK